MNVRSLIRDATRVQACLEELPDGSLIAKRPIKIYIPTRFVERGLAEIGAESHIVGIYAMVVEDTYYAVSLVNAMLPILPTSIVELKINGDGYYEFMFAAGSVIFPTTDLVKTDILVYRIYDEIISKGRVPWYLGYTELGHLFDSALYHAGANIGQNNEVTELIVSLIARDSVDRTKYYRSVALTQEDLINNPPTFIPLKSVTYAATNTTNKLAGSYWSVGVVSALVSPSDRVESIERLLRS